MKDLKDLLAVTREQYPLDAKGEFPPEMNDAIFIPGVGTNCVHYYFLLDFAKRVTTCWTVDLKRIYEEFLSRMGHIVKPVVPWNQETLAKFIEVIHYPHSADYWEDWIYVTLIEGSFILALHAYSDEYQLIFDKNAGDNMIYSSTNQIRNGKIHFTRWNIEETFVHEAQRDLPVCLHLGTFDISKQSFATLTTLLGPDDIHCTAASPAGDAVILVEMTQDTLSQMPRDYDFEMLSSEEKREILSAGIHSSELITHNCETGTTERLHVGGGPAHIEWDLRDPELFYLSSHNLVTNNDTLYCFGNTRIDRFRVARGHCIREKSYESSDLLRGPSHKVLRLRDCSYLVIPVYPNQIHIVDLNSMNVYKRINLGRKQPDPLNFCSGPIRYPTSSVDKTPYTICPVNETPYLFLCSVWNVSSLNFETEQKLASVVYNRDKPLMMMGHASQFHLS